MWIKIQQIQQYADIYSLQNYPTCFGCGHTTCTATPLQLRPDQTTLEGSGGTSNMTCTGGCGYSF